MPDIFDEVADDLRAERAKSLLLRFGGLLAGLALLVVLAAAGWQGWRWYSAQGNMKVAGQFMAAMDQAGGASPSVPAAGPAQKQAADAFAAIAAQGPQGYRTLARLREAAIRADGGELPAALALWDQVAADRDADQPLRDLASLLWVQRQVDVGDPALLMARLKPLTSPDNLWHSLALEEQALISLRTGDTAQARDTLRQLAGDITAPQGVRGRASGLLSRLGG